MDNKIFSEEELQKCILEKQQVYDALNGRVVRCHKLKNEDITLFFVKDIENGKIYVIDEECG